ncbi:hypothetical protein LINPERHAP2_LOCUS6428 [Linum perenne]
MSTTVVKQRQGSHIMILHDQKPCSISTPLVAANPPRNQLATYLNQLSDSEKHNARMREAALGGMVGALTRMPARRDEEFVESNRVSLVDGCLRVIGKRRSTAEMEVAAVVIGLVAMILDDVEAANEVLRISAPKLFEAVVKLRGGSKLKEAPVKVVECLAVVTFFGAYLSVDRLESMALIWSPFFEDSGKKEGKHPPELVAAAISSWCFILTNNYYGIGRTHWQTKLPIFLRLLDHEHDSLAVAAAEALALIFEIESRYKGSQFSDINDENPLEQLKHSIVQKVEERKLAMEAIKSKEVNKMAARLALVSKCFEGVAFERITKGDMTLGTWAENLQLTFLERFLGEEALAEHVKVNKQLQSMFNVKKAKKAVAAGKQPVEVEREEVKSRYYKPTLKWIADEDGLPYFGENKEKHIYKRLTKSPGSWWSKVKTQHRKQQRLVAANDRGKNLFSTMTD